MSLRSAAGCSGRTVSTRMPIVAVPILMFATAGLAQESGTRDASAGGIDDVVVTARAYRPEADSTATKLGIPIAETAGTINILNQDILKDLSATDFVAAADYVPGVVTEGEGWGSAYNFKARGFQLGANNVKVNGASIGTRRVENVAIERLEYVKGANAVYYGEVSAAGFLNLATREAPQEFSSSFRVAAGSFDTYSGEATFGGPLTGSGRVRGLLGLSKRQSGEYYDFGNTDASAAYVTLAADITDSVRASAYFYRDDQEMVWNTGFPAALDADGRLTVFRYPDNLLATLPSTGQGFETTIMQARVTFDLVEALTVVLSAARSATELVARENSPLGLGDPDFSSGPAGGFPYPSLDPASIAYGRARMFPFLYTDSEDNEYIEARLQGRKSLTGYLDVDYYASFELRERAFQRSFREIGGFPTVEDAIFNIFQPNYNAPNPYSRIGPFVDTSRNENDIRSYSGVASLDFFDRLRFNVGYRRDQRDGSFLGIADLTDPQNTTSRRRFDNSFTSSSASLVWSVRDHVHAYASYGESYTFVQRLDCNRATLEPESGEMAEVGVKWEPNPRLLATIAYFDAASTGTPLEIGLCPVGTANAGFGAAFNSAAEAFGEGVEVELIGNITPAWNIVFGYANVDDGVDGGLLRSTPRDAASLFTVYDFLGGPLKGFGIGVGGRWEAERPLADEPAALLQGAEVGDFFRIDVALMYRFSDKVDLALNVHNLNDEEYYSTFGDLCCDYIRQAPRSFTLTVNAKL